MQPPAQELVARDLHDNLWTFRHIYRGMFFSIWKTLQLNQNLGFESLKLSRSKFHFFLKYFLSNQFTSPNSGFLDSTLEFITRA